MARTLSANGIVIARERPWQSLKPLRRITVDMRLIFGTRRRELVFTTVWISVILSTLLFALLFPLHLSLSLFLLTSGYYCSSTLVNAFLRHSLLIILRCLNIHS